MKNKWVSKVTSAEANTIYVDLPPAPSHDCQTCGEEMSMVMIEKPSGWRCMACDPQKDEEIRYVPRAEHEALKASFAQTLDCLETALRYARELEGKILGKVAEPFDESPLRKEKAAGTGATQSQNRPECQGSRGNAAGGSSLG